MATRLIAVLADRRGSGTCQSCGAHLTWFYTMAGRPIPFNASPTRQDARTEAGRLVEYYSSADSHWATCPDAKRWKRGRSGKR